MQRLARGRCGGYWSWLKRPKATYRPLVSYFIRVTLLTTPPVPMSLHTVVPAALSLTGRNLLTWTDYTGYDPEVGDIVGGDDSANGQYPNFRTVTAVLELIF